ncbi:MAG TPA: hypothetical protein VGT44_11555 [Ktedonobacteraceae bacterium]|nr:hypothetical protein [Ktedonobacteraceae bacterium]
MIDRDAFTPEEGDEQNQALIGQLRRMYGTRAEDELSLARARVRLLQNSREALPRSPDVKPVQGVHSLPASPQRRREGKRKMQFIDTAIYERRSWQHRLAMIAAVFFIVVLVGSLALILIHRQQSNFANPPQLRPGWTQAAYLSGSGNQTFTHLHIALSTLWGESDSCTGNGNLDIRMQLRDASYEGGGSCPRLTPPSPLIGPDGINLESSSQIVDTITVKAASSINWYLQLSNADVTPAPVLNQFTAPHSGWTSVGGIGGGYAYSSNGLIKDEGTFDLAETNPSLKALAFVSICVGNGGMTIQVTPPAPGVTFATVVCDGQPHLKMTASHIQNVTVIGDRGVIFQLYVYACTNARGCQS